MSLARHGLRRRLTCNSLPVIQTRLATLDSHSKHEDAHVYPQEGFNTPFWRKTIIFTLFGVGIYNLAPYLDSEGTYITRYIQHYATPGGVWARLNHRHLEQAAEAAHGQLLISSAERPRVFRLRNPGAFDNGSPHCVAVGGETDVSNVTVKKDKAWTE